MTCPYCACGYHPGCVGDHCACGCSHAGSLLRAFAYGLILCTIAVTLAYGIVQVALAVAVS
jgi:hypothetical protein